MTTVTLLCPICDSPLEGPDNVEDDTLLNCTNPLGSHAITYKSALDQMAQRIETKIASDIESMFKKSGI